MAGSSCTPFSSLALVWWQQKWDALQKKKICFGVTYLQMAMRSALFILLSDHRRIFSPMIIHLLLAIAFPCVCVCWLRQSRSAIMLAESRWARLKKKPPTSDIRSTFYLLEPFWDWAWHDYNAPDSHYRSSSIHPFRRKIYLASSRQNGQNGRAKIALSLSLSLEKWSYDASRVLLFGRQLFWRRKANV